MKVTRDVIEIANFEDEGVRIEIAMRFDHPPPETFEDCQVDPDVFDLIEKIIDLKLVDTSARPIAVLTKFSPPIVLNVRYNSTQFQKAKRPLRLGYCGVNGRIWQPFPVQQLFPDNPDHPEQGGWGVAVISEWEDPAVGWGH